MKFFHLSDLHLGKRVYEYSMLEEQRVILQQIIKLAQIHTVDAVLIAGDIYDKPVPPAEAVQLFDQFLTALTAQKIAVCIISGNHDSAERIAFGAHLLQQSGVWLSPVFDGTMSCVDFADAYGTVHVWMLPFLKPAQVRHCFPEETIETYTDAVRVVLKHTPLCKTDRNVFLMHQFVTGASRSDSEELVIGGLDNVNADVLTAFDYAALGHIHTPQMVAGNPNWRYCGTPLKYSFSEAQQEKSVSLVTLAEKGNVTVTCLPLHPLHDLRQLRGTFAQLFAMHAEEYVHLILTDEEETPEALAKLRLSFPRLMKLTYDNCRTRAAQIEDTAPENAQMQDPLTVFAQFYAQQNGQEMGAEQLAFCQSLQKEIWEESE